MIVKSETVVAWREGLPLVLGMETPTEARPAQSAARGSRSDSDDEPQQPALECTAHSRRVAGNWASKITEPTAAKYMGDIEIHLHRVGGPSWTTM